MKNLALITIGILLSLSSFGQVFTVSEQLYIEDGDTTELSSEEYDFPVTDVDVKPIGKSKDKIVLINKNKNVKMVLKCKTVDGFYKDEEKKDHFIFVLQHDVVGKIHLEIDNEGTVTNIYLDHNKETNEFSTLLVLK